VCEDVIGGGPNGSGSGRAAQGNEFWLVVLLEEEDLLDFMEAHVLKVGVRGAKEVLGAIIRDLAPVILFLNLVQTGSDRLWRMSKNSSVEFGLFVLVLHLCVSFLSGLDQGLEGVQEVSADGNVLYEGEEAGNW
jgi:hypothetical protein